MIRFARRQRSAYIFQIIGCFLIILLSLTGCGGMRTTTAPTPAAPPSVTQEELATRGYSIQVGAFSRVQNAANLSEALRLRDIDATYFLADDGLFKVRFGNFPTREAARSHADVLRKAGVIEAFYIVSPDDYAVTKGQRLGTSYVRSEIVKTAKSFLGVPYLWGGTSAATGFDCSGLTAATYHLNGLDLPRAAREQFLAGKPVERDELALGDLVFFANTQEEISHVGIFIGNGRFIHAPGQGKTIREDSLSDKYYSKWFRGGRSYL